MNKEIFAILAITLLVLPTIAIAQEDLPTPEVVPGHWAYGLKRAWENVRLVFVRDPNSKAKMHLELARERVAEAKMVAESKPEETGKLMEQYQKHIRNAEGEIEKSRGLGKDVSELVKEMEESNQRHRAVLELVKNKVPEQAKESIQRAIDKSDEFEGKMEQVREEVEARKGQETGEDDTGEGEMEQEREREELGDQEGETEREREQEEISDEQEEDDSGDQEDDEETDDQKGQGTGKGTLVMKITDKPVEGEIKSVNVTISEVKIHKADYDAVEDEEDDEGGGWITVLEEERTYDLIKLEDVEELLAIAEGMDVGRYTQIRLYLSGASIGIDNNEPQDLEITSPSLKLVKPFDIREGEVTELLLDFDAKESVIQVGRTERYKLKPTIKVIASYTTATTTTTIETTTTTTVEETTTTTVEPTTTIVEMTTTTTIEETTTTTEEPTTTTLTEETTTTIEAV